MRGVLFPPLAAVLLLTSAACRRAPAPAAAPTAEFLVVAGDSTVWVRNDGDGFYGRAAPMRLARLTGPDDSVPSYLELYTVDDDRSFYDAVIVGQQLYARALDSDDSLVVFEDTVMAAFADRYARTHPDERMLRPDEDGSPEPRITATSDLSLLSQTGPYLSYEYHGSGAAVGGEEWEVAWRGVVDLRTGERVALRDLLGAREAARVLAAGQRALEQLEDSVLAHEGRRGSWRTLIDVAFDSLSFTLAAVDGAPMIIFAAEARGDSAGGALLSLPPVPIQAPAWWSAERDAFPVVTPDSAQARWAFGAYTVLAERDSLDGGARLVVVDSAGRRWTAAHLPTMATRVYRLDAPPIHQDTRRALERAFDAAALYREDARTAMTSPSPSGQPVHESQHEMSELMMPQHANILGHVFGGVILSMMDRAAAVAAIRHARRTCVTVSVDRVDFREPIQLGDLVVMKASVNFAGRTSMEVGVRVEAENLLTGVRRHTNSCYLTFVAIDEHHVPVAVPPVVPATPLERRRYAAAQERRRRRLEERQAERRDDDA